MTQNHPSQDELAAYTANTLSAYDSAVVERHLIECRECRDVVTVGMLVRDNSLRKRRPVRFAVPFAVTLAAAAIAFWIWTGSSVSLRQLGNLSKAPRYDGVPVRAAANQGDSLFRAGMAEYSRGQFSDAAMALQRARAAGADSAATSFFLGISALMQDSAETAVTELTHAASTHASPYTIESGYYLAKALIRLGERDSAMAVLRDAAESDDPIAPTARSLLDSVTGVSARR